MRFNRLDILRYGALTDRIINLKPDAGLHVIYGPNEAGKSSALKAITDLLFGFPTVAENSFLHDPASLRVGAEILARDGTALEFRRRRGRKNTLLAATAGEDPLAEDALAPFLGTLSRDVFQRAFGLDSETLRAGGAAMLKSGGEIGQLLFSAASGLTGLSNLRKQIETEADGIYAPRKSKDRLFYQVLDAHDEARQAERHSELKASDWKKLLAEQADLDSQQAEIETERRQTKLRLEELRRLLRLQPLLKDLDRLRLQLEPHSALPPVPRGFDDQFATAIERLRDLLHRHDAARVEIDRLAEERDTTVIDADLLSLHARILAAHAQKGAYLNAREDIAHVRREVDGFDQRLVQAARRLGFASFDALASAQPTDADLVRLKSLVEQGGSLDRDVRHSRQQIEQSQETLRRLSGDRGATRLVDPKPWAEKLAALRPDLVEIAAEESLRVRLSRAQSDLAAAVARLDPPIHDVPALLSAPLPDLATLASHRSAIEAARAECAAVAGKLASQNDEVEAIKGQMQALEGDAAIVSRDEIVAARARRDALLAGLDSRAGGEARLEMEAALHEADHLADSALADAERVSRHAQMKLRARELEQAIEVSRKLWREKDIAASDALTDFEDLFRASNVKPTTPAQMIEWRRAVQDVAVLAAAVDDARDGLDVVLMRQERLVPVLSGLAQAIGLEEAGLPAPALARAIERRLEEISTNWTETRAIEGKRRAAEEALETLEQQQLELRRSVEQWQDGFSHAAMQAGLPEDASVEMASAALDVWKTLPDLMHERENRARRVRGMARDMEDFESEIRGLCGELSAADLLELPADLATDMLSRRLNDAQSAKSHRGAVEASLQRAELVASRLDETMRDARQVLSELGQAIGEDGVADVAQAETLLSGLREKLRVENELELVTRRLAEEGGSMSEKAARSALADLDIIQAGLEIERLEAEEGRQFERMRVLGSAQAESDRRRHELETGIGAERAVFQKLAAEEEARDLARRWVVLKLAASLLANSLEVYREKQADPVMQRAGQVFATLTGGRFARLVQIYDESDELRLAAERANGERVGLDGLSEGTGDQLYLALRLAFLDDYAAHNEPAPLILDDIFQTFDDERTAAGVNTLAGYGERFQTILFTHQQSLVDIARDQLGQKVDIIRLDGV